MIILTESLAEERAMINKYLATLPRWEQSGIDCRADVAYAANYRTYSTLHAEEPEPLRHVQAQTAAAGAFHESRRSDLALSSIGVRIIGRAEL